MPITHDAEESLSSNQDPPSPPSTHHRSTQNPPCPHSSDQGHGRLGSRPIPEGSFEHPDFIIWVAIDSWTLRAGRARCPEHLVGDELASLVQGPSCWDVYRISRWLRALALWAQHRVSHSIGTKMQLSPRYLSAAAQWPPPCRCSAHKHSARLPRVLNNARYRRNGAQALAVRLEPTSSR